MRVRYSRVTSHLHLDLPLLSCKFCTDITPANSPTKWEACTKARNYIKNDCDQETGKEYCTIVQIIIKDNREKAIAWCSVNCKMTYYHVSEKKQYKISVCILHPVCSQQSAFCTGRIGIAVFVQTSLKSWPKYIAARPATGPLDVLENNKFQVWSSSQF